ncbi:hypothetical protein KHT87_22995, partial [Alkalihalobacillus clausii]|uniref:hypothetical protein n=1 Tax=Shouchella clausii TaxID=79880 RepID=UPI001C0DBBA4
GYLGASAVGNAFSTLTTNLSAANSNIASNTSAITAIQSAISGYSGANAVSNAFNTLTTGLSVANSNIATNASAISTV